MRILVNDAIVETEAWALAPALDFIRKDLGLTGTKEGCREGDCGACAVLVGEKRVSPTGERRDSSFSYRAMPSCLLALGELEGRHLVTIEGLAAAGQTPVMRALAEANGSQCGFCSPGFVVSLTAYLLGGGAREGGAREGARISVEGAFSAVEGNLCRCTGYGAIKRAATRLVEEFATLPADPSARLDVLVTSGVVPASLLGFSSGRIVLAYGRGDSMPGAKAPDIRGFVLGGGTDFFVRNPEPDRGVYPEFTLLRRRPELRRVELRSAQNGHGPHLEVGPHLEIGAALSWREFFSEPKVLELVPGIEAFEQALASPLVRERATIGGNIANASPVGDLTAMLLALGARVRIVGGRGERVVPLAALFLGYKKLDLSPSRHGNGGEIIASVLLPAARRVDLFNFEKVSKRERLDIAAVNSAAAFELEQVAGEPVSDTARSISAGGVAPVPLLLTKASAFLAGAAPDAATALEAARIARAKSRRSATSAALPTTGAASSSASSSLISFGFSPNRAWRAIA